MTRAAGSAASGAVAGGVSRPQRTALVTSSETTSRVISTVSASNCQARSDDSACQAGPGHGAGQRWEREVRDVLAARVHDSLPGSRRACPVAKRARLS